MILIYVRNEGERRKLNQIMYRVKPHQPTLAHKRRLEYNIEILYIEVYDSNI